LGGGPLLDPQVENARKEKTIPGKKVGWLGGTKPRQKGVNWGTNTPVSGKEGKKSIPNGASRLLRRVTKLDNTKEARDNCFDLRGRTGAK